MVNCSLKRNRNNSRCKAIRSIRNKPKKSLNWKQAKARYPKLKPYGNADRDMHVNRKDCRPFNKKMHEYIPFENCSYVIFLDRPTYEALQYIKYGREMGLPPHETHNILKEKGFNGDQMRHAMATYMKMKDPSVCVEKND